MKGLNVKLGELRTALRATVGDVLVEVTLNGKVILVPVQKTKFLKEPLDAFGSQRNDETGLILSDGVLRAELSDDLSTGHSLEDLQLEELDLSDDPDFDLLG